MLDRQIPGPAGSGPELPSEVPVGPSTVLVDGPWQHRYVAANGARFHLAETGVGPLVIFLHGFPQFWWTWRGQVPVVGEVGYRAVAMDLRGYGASDKPPSGYSQWNLAADVASVIRALGESDAVVVGHGVGGTLAWTLAYLYPEQVRAIAVVGAPHPNIWPASRSDWPYSIPGVPGANAFLGSAKSRVVERRITNDPDTVSRMLCAWAAPGSGWPSPEVAARYAAAMSLPFAAHTAGRTHRWRVQSPLRPEGRQLHRVLSVPMEAPVLHLHGTCDPLTSIEAARRSARYAPAYERVAVPGAGHFPQEENPAFVSERLTHWLAGVCA